MAKVNKGYEDASYTAIQVRSKAIVVYQAYVNKRESRTEKQQLQSKNLTAEKTYTGKITAGSKKRITRAVENLIMRSRLKQVEVSKFRAKVNHKLSFVTLTIPDQEPQISADVGYKLLLKPFIRMFQDRGLMIDYVFKYEIQKRGQAHWHLTTNNYIQFWQIRNAWNKLLFQNNLMDDYITKFNNINPNSTDVHSVYKVSDIAAYLVKYLSKEVGDEFFTKGRVWGCSDSLKGKGYYSDALNSENYSKLNQLFKAGEVDIVKCDKCHIVKFKKYLPSSILTANQKLEFEAYVKS